MSHFGSADSTQRLRRIVIIAGKKSHGPDNNGIHDYPAQARLLQDCLQRSVLGKNEKLSITRSEKDEWPVEAIAAADCVVIIGDGRDGDLPYAEASHLATPERIAQLEALTARGTGVVAIHFSTFACERDLERAQRWQGGCFQWEREGKRDWYSTITWAKGVFDLSLSNHPTLRGVDASKPLHEEYYHKLAFHPKTVPLVSVKALLGENNSEKVVAWALDRTQIENAKHGENIGRGFGTTMAHSVDSLRHNGLRTLLLNGIAWAAGLEIPAEGLNVPFAEREELNYRLNVGPAVKPIRVAVLTGNAAHRWHNGVETTASLLRAWGDDPRITARVHTDPADLATALSDRDVLVLNWCNWNDPAGMPEAAKAGIQAFVARGGGVFAHHFAGGACHPSLPEAGASDWPWYRTLVRNSWEHRPIAPGGSGHDNFRAFEVKAKGLHPLAALLPASTIEDELYWRQHDNTPTEPAEVLLQARSEVTGADEPLAWAYQVGSARVVQSLLGHSTKTYESATMRAFARRVIAWVAQRAIHGPNDGP